MKFNTLALLTTLFVALPLVAAAPPSSMPRAKKQPTRQASAAPLTFERFLQQAAACMAQCAEETSFPDKRAEAAALSASLVRPATKNSHPHSLLRTLKGVLIYHDPENPASASNHVEFNGKHQAGVIKINTARFPTTDSMEEAIAHEMRHVEYAHGLYTLALEQVPDLNHPEVINQVERCNEIEADTFSLFNCDEKKCTFVEQRYRGAHAFLNADEAFQTKAEQAITDFTDSALPRVQAEDRSRAEALAQKISRDMSSESTHPSPQSRRDHIRDVEKLVQTHNGIVPQRELERLVAQHAECGKTMVKLIKHLEKQLKYSLDVQDIDIHVPSRFS